MTHPDPHILRRQAQQLRHQELARIARAAAIKWSTFWKPSHAPHPRQVPHPTHP
jgi:hypothetical protein